MNTSPDTSQIRALRHRLARAERSIAHRTMEAIAAEGVSPREYFALRHLGTDSAFRDHRPGGRGKKLRHLIERGWVQPTEDGADGAELTPEGVATKERVDAALATVREAIDGAVSADDLAVTSAALDAIIEALGAADEDADDAPHRRPGRFPAPGMGPGFRHGGRGGRLVPPPFGFDRRGERGERGREHYGHREPGSHRHGDRRAERAFERGFEAGIRHAQNAPAD